MPTYSNRSLTPPVVTMVLVDHCWELLPCCLTLPVLLVLVLLVLGLLLRMMMALLLLLAGGGGLLSQRRSCGAGQRPAGPGGDAGEWQCSPLVLLVTGSCSAGHGASAASECS